MNEYQERLERVAKVSKVIFDVSNVAGMRTKQILCPHGNVPSYPTHAWWCDKCFWELEEALQDLEDFQLGAYPNAQTLDRIQESYEMLVDETDNPMTHRDREKNQRLNDLLELFEYLQGEQEANPIIRWFDII